VKEGKPAKTYFLRAKSRFEKTAAIAKAAGDQMSRDVQTMQTAITERLSKVRADLDRSKLSPRVKGQIKPIAAEVEEESASIDSLVSQRNFVKAKTLAKDAQSKIYNAELILAGKKPNP
jgi:DNA-binding transcriptional regulator GbsR (MarR family)